MMAALEAVVPSVARDLLWVITWHEWQMETKRYYVYILSSLSRVLYVGVTNDLVRRVMEHRQGILSGFAHKYQATRLVYYEETANVYAAICREKEIKAWRREKKLALVETVNVGWLDLAVDLGVPPKN
jgi:putative endonuclease